MIQKNSRRRESPFDSRQYVTYEYKYITRGINVVHCMYKGIFLIGLLYLMVASLSV